MAKKTITPGLFRHPAFMELSMEARVLYLGLRSAVDGEGQVAMTPKQVKAELMPADEVDVYALLGDLVKGGMIGVLDDPLRYELTDIGVEKRRKKSAPTDAPSTATTEKVRQVWVCYLQTFEKQRAMLDDKRRRVITRAIESGYSVETLFECLKGYRASRWHMGENERGIKYDSIELFLRDAQHIDKGLEYFETVGPGKVQRGNGGGNGIQQGTSPEGKWDPTAELPGEVRTQRDARARDRAPAGASNTGGVDRGAYARE